MSKRHDSLFSRLFGRNKDGSPKKAHVEPNKIKAEESRSNSDHPKSQLQATQPRQPDDLATIAVPASKDAASIKAAEEKVPLEWDVSDVILDLYEVKHVYRTGGMGLVYRVHHRSWDIDLAVKSPRADFFKTEAQKDNFISECETWTNLGLHPNTVSCYYVRNLGGIPRVFAEYVEDGSLKDWIDNRKLYEGGKKKALERILDTAIQFSWGLQFAHEKGLVHQDVKPANVMMTEDGTAKVTDFGLAKARAAAEEVTGSGAQQSILVSSGGMTPAYCSPEQANKQKLYHKTDIWSWGLSVLEMFTGEVTWMAGQTAPQALDGYLQTGAMDESIPKMPDGLAELLRQCFQRKPADRPKDMREIVERLKEIYSEVAEKEYPRPEPKAATLLADALNNQAISMLDLGRQEEAEELFERALQSDPHHLEAVFNRGLMLWRTGRLTDDALVTQLEEVRTSHEGDWRNEYYLGIVHMERGDAEAAVEVLEEALEQSPDSDEIQRAFTTSRQGRDKWRSCLRIFKGHRDEVRSVTISPDSRWALSGSADKTLRLWELATGECVRVFEGHAGAVNGVAISPDGRWGLSGGDDKSLKLWELASGRCVRTFDGHTNGVNSVAISPDGRWALSGSGDVTPHKEDFRLRLWDIATGKCVRAFEGHTELVSRVAFCPNGPSGISGSFDGTLKLWDLITGQCVKTIETGSGSIETGSGSIYSVSIAPDGCRALSGGNGSLYLWDLTTGKCVRTFEGHGHEWMVESVSINSDGRFAFSSATEENVRLWDVGTGQCVRTFVAHPEGVSAACLSPNDRWGLTGAMNGDLQLWELRASGPSGKFVVAIPRSSKEALAAQKLVFEATKKAKLALEQGSASKAAEEVSRARRMPEYERNRDLLGLWRESGLRGRCCGFSDVLSVSNFQDHAEWVLSTSISPDGRWALSGHKKMLRLWDRATGKCLRVFDGHKDCVNSLVFSRDNRWLLSGSGDKTLKLWELATGECVRTFAEHTDRVQSVSIGPDSRWVLSGSQDKTLKLWELPTGRCVRTLEGHNGHVNSVAISPDGSWVMSGSDDATLKLWELSTGRCVKTFEGHEYSVNSVAISSDGCRVLSGSGDRTLKLWELATGQCLRTLEGHALEVNSVCFSPDSRWVLSVSGDHTLRLWELATGRCVRAFERHTEGVWSVSFSLDSRWVLSGGRDMTLMLWELVWDYEFPEPSDWNEGARPYLDNFLTLHCPLGKDGISRVRKPKWDDEDFNTLVEELQHRGYGWLRPEGMRKKLEELTVNWQGPPPLPGKE